MDSDSEPVRFDTKIAVLLRDDLEVWQRLNVASFLVSGIGQRAPEVLGEPYADADGTEYLPMFRQPVLVWVRKWNVSHKATSEMTTAKNSDNATIRSS